MSGPSPSPPQCSHEHTYYDEKGLRCKDCHRYLPREPKPHKGSRGD